MVKPLAGQVGKVPGFKRFAVWISNWTSSDFAPYPETSRANGFLNFYNECWRAVAGSRVSPPRLFWSYRDRHASARVAGRTHRPVVAISAGLVWLFPQQSEVIRVYLLHEFGHIFNRDLEVFALTMAGSRACKTVMLSSFVTSALFLLPFFDGTIGSALILLVGTMWLLSLLVLWVWLARYAGVILSLRELYADVQAVLWLPNLSAYETVLSGRASPRRNRLWRKLRSLVSLRLIHLSPNERLSFLRRPESLMFPRHRYYMLVGLLLIALQSSPFGEGYENNWMRWSFLLAWAPVCLAYLMNSGRAIMGLALLPRKRRFASIGALSLGVATVLLLPMFRIPGLYGDFVLSLDKWETFRSGIKDSAATIAAQWGHIEYLGVPILAAIWLSLSYRFARYRLQYIDSQTSKEIIATYNRAFFVISLLGVAVETALLAIRDYGNTGPTFLDSWQVALGTLRSAPAIAALCVLVPGVFWVWRRRT
jgi:hypothetical protein